MISRVVIKNFKSIGEPGVDLELKPLTLLVGPNGGGKSSILEAVAVAIQGEFSGKLTNFPSGESILHKPDGLQSLIDLCFDSNEPEVTIQFDAVSGQPTIDYHTDDRRIRQTLALEFSQLRSNTFLS